jgi:hypothetical protein
MTTAPTNPRLHNVSCHRSSRSLRGSRVSCMSGDYPTRALFMHRERESHPSSRRERVRPRSLVYPRAQVIVTLTEPRYWSGASSIAPPEEPEPEEPGAPVAVPEAVPIIG